MSIRPIPAWSLAAPAAAGHRGETRGLVSSRAGRGETRPRAQLPARLGRMAAQAAAGLAPARGCRGDNRTSKGNRREGTGPCGPCSRVVSVRKNIAVHPVFSSSFPVVGFLPPPRGCRISSTPLRLQDFFHLAVCRGAPSPLRLKFFWAAAGLKRKHPRDTFILWFIS